jgi:hypothetical protein
MTHADRFWANIRNRRFARAQGALAKSTSKWKHLTDGRLDYMDDVLSETGVRLALDHASGRLRRALATSLRKVNKRVRRKMRRAS